MEPTKTKTINQPDTSFVQNETSNPLFTPRAITQPVSGINITPQATGSIKNPLTGQGQASTIPTFTQKFQGPLSPEFIQTGKTQPVVSTNIIGTEPIKGLPTEPTPTKANEDLGVRVSSQMTTPAPVAEIPQPQVKQQKQVEKPKSTVDMLREYIGLAGGESADRAKLMTDLQVEDTAKQLQTIKNEYASTENSYSKRIEELRKNPAGYTSDRLNADIAEINRQKNSELADIAIRQNAVSGNLNTAISLVDAKIKAEYEPIQNNIKNLLNFAQVEGNDLTESQKLALTQKANEAQNNLNFLQQLKSDAYKAVLKYAEDNGTPVDANMLSNLSNAKTEADIISATGGIYTGSNVSRGIYDILDYRTANAVISQADTFAKSDIVKKYNGLVSAANLINGIDKNTKNPADHQAIVYEFAKALDPDSVVREGEYETIKKYSQGLASRFRGELKQAISGTGFLSPTAIESIKTTTNNRIASYKPQYDNLSNQTSQTINQIAGKDVAGLVLKDFEGGYSQGGGTVSETSLYEF